MRTFFFEHKRSAITLIIAISWIALFSIWKGLVTADPIDIPINLGTDDQLEQTVLIFSPESYTVNLVVERGNKSSEELGRLVGGMQAFRVGETAPSLGVLVPLEWKLFDVANGRLVASGRADSAQATAWSATHIFRSIGYFSVPAGWYTFNARTLNATPGLLEVPTRIVAQTRGSSSNTWQMSLVWFGSIAAFLVAWPAMAFAGIFLGYQFLTKLRIRRPEER